MSGPALTWEIRDSVAQGLDGKAAEFRQQGDIYATVANSEPVDMIDPSK